METVEPIDFWTSQSHGKPMKAEPLHQLWQTWREGAESTLILPEEYNNVMDRDSQPPSTPFWNGMRWQLTIAELKSRNNKKISSRSFYPEATAMGASGEGISV